MSNEILPPGSYLARAREWAFTEAKTGTPQAYVLFDFVEQGLGSISAYLPLSEAAFEHSMKGLTACGYDGVDLVNDLGRADCGINKNTVELVVEHDTYQGKTRAKVKWVNKPGAEVKQVDPARKATFAAELKAKAAAFRQGQVAGGQATKPKPVTSSAPVSGNGGPPPGHPADLDIPF